MTELTLARKGFMRIFNISKEAVTVYEVSKERDAEDNSVLTITSTNATYAKINRGGETDIKDARVGQIPDADAVAYFPYNYTTGLIVGNYMAYDSRRFRIERVSEYRIAGTSALVYTKVWLKESNAILHTDL